MAYTYGTATTRDDLLDNLRTFLIAQGWTVDLWADYTQTYEAWSGLVGSGKRLHVHRTMRDGTTGYFHLRSVYKGIVAATHDGSVTKINGYYRAELNGIGLYYSTGYSGALAWDQQPGYTVYPPAVTGLYGTSYDYWIVHHTDTVMMCWLNPSGYYQWLAFGMLVKAGTYTGGYFAATEHRCYDPSLMYEGAGRGLAGLFSWLPDNQYCDHIYFNPADGNGLGYYYTQASDDHNAGYIKFPSCNPAADPNWYYDCNGICGALIALTPNNINGVVPFIPIHVMYKNATSRYNYLGHVEGARIVRTITYTEGEEVTIGNNTWKVLPHWSRDVAESPAQIGFALLVS
jgi:hypothetical protein